MKKAVVLILLGAGFLLGLMIFGYMAEPVSPASADLPDAPPISAKQAVLIDGKTGEVLFEKNADEKAYPASTTKIMTALIALELCKQYDIDIRQKVCVPKEAVGVEGSSLYLKEGQKITIEDLLYGVMLRSGNDGATALACVLGGNQKHFVELMNKRAEALECAGTQFVNPTGLFDEEHYTTAKELAVIAREAMKNKVFRKVVGTKSWKTYYNKNKTVHEYAGATGIKIGFTEKSGRTLVASAKRGEAELICVVLNDGNWFNDAYELLDYGFEMKGCKDGE